LSEWQVKLSCQEKGKKKCLEKGKEESGLRASMPLFMGPES